MSSDHLSTNMPLEESLKDPSASRISTGQQQPLGGRQTDAPTGEATSGEPSIAENLPTPPPALESPPRGGQPAEISAENLPIAEDPSRILVSEVNNISASIPNLRPVRGPEPPLVAPASLSKLGSVAGRMERIINDSTKEISNSNEPLSPGTGRYPPHRDPDQDLRTGHTDDTFTLHYSKVNSGNLPSQKNAHEDIMNGRYECLLCRKYVRPVSYTWTCPICSRILHLSCAEDWLGVELPSEKPETMEDLRCPACYRDPLQNISDQLSEDKSRHPRVKRTFEETDESVTDDDDTDSESIIAEDEGEPPFKKHQGAMILGIDNLTEVAKEERIQIA